MELQVTELDDNEIVYSTNPQHLKKLEKIPENNFQNKIIKKDTRVSFSENTKESSIKPIPRQQARLVRPNVPAPKPKISYDDILAKMGMFVAEGKLHLIDNLPKEQVENYLQNQKSVQNPIQKQKSVEKPSQDNLVPKNSYIYNKYFKEHTQAQQVQRPLTPLEYRNMLINDILERQKIKQMKSTKLIMPTANINVAPNSSSMNKLFHFSQR
jgi:hypothetical protein